MVVLERNQSGENPGRTGRSQSDCTDWQAEVISNEDRFGEHINIAGEFPPSSTVKPCLSAMWVLKGNVNPDKLRHWGASGCTYIFRNTIHPGFYIRHPLQFLGIHKHHSTATDSCRRGNLQVLHL